MSSGLRDMDIEQRREIQNQERRELVSTLDELLFRRDTCGAALRSILLLAEAENENIGNNATALFV